METRTFGRTRITLPGLDGAGIYLSNVSSLENSRGIVQDFSFGDADLRDIDLASAQLQSGRVTGITAKRTTLSEVRVDSVEFASCDFGAAQWTDVKLSRVSFHDCKLMGASFNGATMSDVLFEGCKLDYATFEQVRATGPVVFSRCVLAEATFTGCNLSGVVFDDCQLRLTEFGPGKYSEADLHTSGLSAVRGVANLNGVILDRVQQDQLAEALVADLNVAWVDELDTPKRRR